MIEVGDKIVMNRESQGFKNFCSSSGNIEVNWWEELEEMEPLKVVCVEEVGIKTTESIEAKTFLLLEGTSYVVFNEWVKKVEEN